MNARNDTVSPESIEAEMALLGAMLLDPEIIEDAAVLAPPDAFRRPDHGRLLALVLRMRREHVPIDRVSVGERVLALGENDYGGYGYVIALPEHCPSRINWRHWAKIVSEKWRRRAFQRAIDEVHAELVAGADLDEVHARAIAALATLDARSDDDDILHISECTTGVMDAAQASEDRRARGESAVAGCPMPLRALADIVPALEPGEIALVAARPAMGKSALARCIAEGVANSPPIGGDGDRRPAAVVFSFEMSPEQVTTLSMASAANVDSRDIRAGRLDQRAWDDLAAARDDLARAALYLYRGPTLTVEVLRAKVSAAASRAWRDGHRLRLVVVDYVQLMRASKHTERGNANERLSHISWGLKDLATSQGVAVLALSQLSRDIEKRSDKMPQLSDLRDSGALEQDAAVVMFPWRPQVYVPEHAADDAYVFVRKNRYGACDDARLRWRGPFTRFEDWPSTQVLPAMPRLGGAR